LAVPTDPPTARRRLTFWSSPEDQPVWARPLLLVVAVVATVLSSWRAGSTLEVYYAAAVRSMSMSWHDFLFGAFDPAGTVTLDKLPGAFWVQALSVRLFGLHTWAIVLPQVVEGVLSVLVLFRIVRRLCGSAAGLLAAGILSVSPATVALNRGNISDSLMILLLLLAADAAVTAATEGRWSRLLLAGFWVGLAFQAKMIEAWIVLPALWLVVAVMSEGRWPMRLARSGAMTAVAIAVSLSWMTAVTLTPANSRPYVDGSPDNSVFHQVFVYNGFGRLDQASPNQLLTQSIGLSIPPPAPPGWNRLLKGPLGRDTGWLVPPALVSLVAGLVVTRRRPRTDRLRVHFLLWGSWLLALAASFSVSSSLNAYYTAALSPPLARLVAGGALAYAAWLLPNEGTGLPGWLGIGVVVVGAVSTVGLLASLLPPTPVPLSPTRLAATGLAAALGAVLLVPVVASTSIVANRLGPFDTPFQPPVVTDAVRVFFGVTADTAALLPRLEQARNGAPFLMVTQTSAVAAPFIFESGQEVLPIGGFTGTIPEPSLTALRSLVAEGKFHLVLQSPTTSDPRLIWVARHCLSVPPPTGKTVPDSSRFAIYYCLPRR
jgi:4-amino-4-deoxy-L-arabinose transferase-like glycosyltransferase